MHSLTSISILDTPCILLWSLCECHLRLCYSATLQDAAWLCSTKGSLAKTRSALGPHTDTWAIPAANCRCQH